MRLNKKYIDIRLNERLTRGIKFKAAKFSKKFIKCLFDKYTNYNMSEYHYCCGGLHHNCWIDDYEEGLWELTLDEVKDIIKSTIDYCGKYLYDTNKFGNRFYYYHDETKNVIHLYIFTRDIVKKDYYIIFNNEP